MSKTVRFSEDSLIMIKNRLNEVMVGTDGVSHNDVSVKLYHGTTVDALLIIMESGIMSAKRGRQNGETYGMNWFSLKEGDNFNRGALFSIEVPSNEFEEKFNMMNNSEAVSKDDELDISAYNLKIEKICGMSSGAIKRNYERYVKEGESYPLERVGNLFDYFMDEVQDNETMFPNLLFRKWEKYFPMIMKNILGENINESVNEAAPEVDEYEIGAESDNPPVGGNGYHINESARFYSEGIIPQGNEYYESKNSKKQIVENKYDDLFNKVNYDLQYFLKQGKEKYGTDGWYISSWMKKTHPEISVDPKDIKIYTALSDRLHKITKLWTNENNKEESEKDLEQPKEIYDIISLAIEEFGLTSRLNQAGYILPDGKLLNFGSDGYRETDHRQIAAVYKQNGIKIWDDEYRYNYVVDFMNHGAIRCDVNSGILDMTKEPTNEQFYAIKDFVRKAVDVDIDFTDDKGNTLHSVSYSDAKPQAVVADIRRYYEDGIKPMGNVQYENKNMNNSHLIIESQESKSIAAAKKLVMQRLNYNEQEADEFIRIKLRNDIPMLRTPQGGKFILGVTRMFCDGELRTANDIGNLNSTLKLVASDAHINEYDRNLNGMSCQELVQRFSKAMSDNLEAEKAEIGQMVFNTPSDYEIVRIDSFEQAEEYGDYVSWCVTHDENMFDSYTSDGINQFYFCLRNGFENVEEVPSEGCPLDEYGLSMIAVSVNENGMLNTCTCRWNHDNGGDDSIMNAKEVSQVIGMNFFDVFKPNNKWKDLLTNAIQRLGNGEDPRTIFDSVDYFREGFARVNLNDKYNFINQEGRFLSDQWFDYVGDFYGGFAMVKLNNKHNYITQECKFLSNQWFDYGDEFREGFARVQLNGKWNFINQECKFLSNQWFEFDDVYNFNEGFAAVELNDKWNFINQKGKLLSGQWFDDAGNFYGGFAMVKLNNKYNYITQECKFLSDQWFDYADYFFSEGFGRVKLNGKWNYINQEGRFLSDQWFDYVGDFKEGFGRVKLNGNVYKLDTSGNLSLSESKNKNKKILIHENQLESIKENFDFEVDSSEIDLSSFKKKHELVPNIWKPDGKLDSRIRLKLLDIADDFWKYVNLTWVEPSGIILTGSICNFNWSQYSDIDLHLIVDFDEIDEKTEFVRDYLDAKKNEWNNEHKGLQIMGYQVELYVQNVGEMPESNGIYDLEENDWIKEPNPDDIKPIRLNKFPIKDKAAKIMTIIDDMYDALAATDDSYEIEQIGDDADYLWKKVKEMRKSSLEKHGESGSGNIVYKILRRTGYLDRLWKISNVVYDKTNSITESVTEGARYDIFRNNQMARYKVIGEMAEDGYVFHGTGEDGNGTEWDTVDPTRIKGGSRGTYGYGIYFTAHAYKCEKYTTYTDGHYIIANINGFDIINLRDKINKDNNIFLDKQKEYYLLQNELDNAKNNRDYNRISSMIEEYDNTVDKDLLNAIIQVISESDENDLTYFYLNNHIPLLWYSDGDPDKQLSKLYLSLGIDGFEFDTEYVLFNFELLNHAIVKDKEALIAKYMQKNIEWFKEKNIHVDESVKKYITVLKEEFALDGSSNSNPYKKRWETERKVLKDFICNNGVLMQSREDNKQGKLYKCFTDTWLSNLIGYNYCLCVQWDEIKMKPKSVVYIRALDKFTPNIRRNMQFDNRGFDNVRGTYDDVRNY